MSFDEQREVTVEFKIDLIVWKSHSQTMSFPKLHV